MATITLPKVLDVSVCKKDKISFFDIDLDGLM
jgi:hypothetical protein